MLLTALIYMKILAITKTYYVFGCSGIVSDLFPRMVEQAVDYGELEKSIRAITLKFGLEDVDGNEPLYVILFYSSKQAL